MYVKKTLHCIALVQNTVHSIAFFFTFFWHLLNEETASGCDFDCIDLHLVLFILDEIMTEKDITFYLGYKLPTMYDAAIAIFSI